MSGSGTNETLPNEPSVTVLSRSLQGNNALLKLSDGQTIKARRFVPIGKRDNVYRSPENLFVLAKNDCEWIEVGRAWRLDLVWQLTGMSNAVTFKEIETEEEFLLFDALRKFHYRGGGGAGRVVPIIAVTNTWELPRVLGFIEICSSMIANTARKRFLDFSYRETTGLGWSKWDRGATKKYSNIIARISRFVIHPEIRGLGLARLFLEAAINFSTERWHYGGFRPRFLEITADMLRYYKFVGQEFACMGDTEGNEHRISKDMAYLVKKALSPEGIKAMPQGGGGVMTMQRSYALQMIKYMEARDVGLRDVINSLRYEPEHLDQETWEALYRLNRRPKPCYIAGLTQESKEYVQKRATILGDVFPQRTLRTDTAQVEYSFNEVSVCVHASVAQSNAARRIQDAFGFVGSELTAEIIQPTSFTLTSGSITLICGASGSGKSLLGRAIRRLCESPAGKSHGCRTRDQEELDIGGSVKPNAKVVELEPLIDSETPLEQVSQLDLDQFITVSAKCGLAEPQLFVRPVNSLSSGQRYRLQLACAFLKRPNILYVDNFCETLDRFTALAVCKGLRSLAIERNVAVVVSTAAYDRALGLVSPDQVIVLRRGNRPLVNLPLGEVGDDL